VADNHQIFYLMKYQQKIQTVHR